jgi:DNA-binding NarL/FixJ family response regulator
MEYESLHIGRNRLTRRESEVLALMSTGLTNKEIARELSIETPTVKSHIRHIYRKLEVPNRLQAILWFVQKV